MSGSVQRSYNGDGNVASENVNDAGPIAFQYDSDKLLIAAGSLSIARSNQNGLVTGAVLGGVAETLDYDSLGALRSQNVAYNGSEIFSVEYDRDNVGRVITKRETSANVINQTAYTYDRGGRLETIARNGVLVASYAYDENGNRTVITTANDIKTATYDAQDRLLSYGASQYTYTANGEISSKTDASGTATFSYDAFGNLITATSPDGTRIDYVIDGQQRRVGKRINGALVQGYLYADQLRIIAELGPNGVVVTRFVYGSRFNVPELMIKSGASYRIISDQQGSPRVVVNASTGEVLQRLDYDEWGNVIADSNPGFQPFGFAGGLYDRDTKLLRFGVRDYDAETQRWTAKDPALFGGLDTNLYAYVQNDPINLFDPWGLSPLSCQCDPSRPSFSDRFSDAFWDRLNETNRFFFGFPTSLARNAIGFGTAGTMARTIGTTTLWQVLRSLATGGGGAVANLSLTNTILSLGVTSVVNGAAVATSLEVGIAAGAAGGALYDSLFGPSTGCQ